MVASGKGGVGKSSLTVCIGRELARLGQKVLLVEMEPGLGTLDLMLGLSRGVCDLSDLCPAARLCRTRLCRWKGKAVCRRS